MKKLILLESEIVTWRGNIEVARPNFKRLGALLSPDEVLRADMLRLPAREQFVFSRGSLRLLLSSYTGIPAQELQFFSNSRGRPLLAPELKISFNVSHSEELCLFAFRLGPKEIGVDIEKIDFSRSLTGLVKKQLTSDEIIRMNALQGDERVRYFYQIWTLKESWVKATGRGVAQTPFKTIEIVYGENGHSIRCQDIGNENEWSLVAVPTPPEFVASLCGKDLRTQTIRHFEIPEALYL